MERQCHRVISLYLQPVRVPETVVKAWHLEEAQYKCSSWNDWMVLASSPAIWNDADDQGFVLDIGTPLGR